MKSLIKTICWISLFAIAMGFLETSVVVYLRKIYYTDGFKFPLVPIESSIAVVETVREAATIIMLAGAGILTGRTKLSRFAYFIYSFAIWDIFYYVFLKIILDWPETLFTWDILFLIPVPWVGPVIAPIIVSFTMILLAIPVFYYEAIGYKVRIKWFPAFLMVAGAFICIYSFCYDYLECTGNKIWAINSDVSLFREIKNYIPEKFNWIIFWVGELTMLLGVAVVCLETRVSVFNKTCQDEH